MKVLVVEPTKLYQRILTQMLSQLGVEVLVASTSDQAMELSRQERYQMVIMSMWVDKMDGASLIRLLRSQATTHWSPIIVLTSEYDNVQLKRTITAGASDIFFKNDLPSFNQYLEDFFERKASQEKVENRILYIEDSKAVAAMCMEELRDLGAEIDHFTAAEPAFDQFLANDYDLIMTDVLLEGHLQGIGLVRKVRALDDERRHVPILAMTAYDNPARKLDLLRAGASDYVSKPVIPEELRIRVNNLLESRNLLNRVLQQQKRIYDMAMTDSLTGLYNRHYLMDVGSKLLSKTARHGHHLSMVVVDIDHFKSINDTHGHSKGDEVLAGIGKVLKSSVRNEDIAARMGGEEFVLLLTHCNIGDAMRKANAIRAQIEAMDEFGFSITASFGVAATSGNKDSQRFDVLFNRADQALYRAKNNGRNLVVASSAMD